MNLLIIVFLAMVLLSIGYMTYGSLVSRLLKLNNSTKTPAYEFENGVDFVPASKFYLLNQHLSAIAAAGPIVGPILAGMWFGWLPTFIWIIFGGIFIGGVHDTVSLVASIRHQGKSIAEVIHDTMSRRAFIVFLLFLWFSLMYIIAAFTDVTASTFADPEHGASIASSSAFYLLLAFVLGIILKIFPLPLTITTIVSIPLVFLCIYVGPFLPIHLPSLLGLDIRMTWNVVLLAYCFFAAVAPVWILLQPRGYLGGFFLLITVGFSLIGLIIGSFIGGGYTIQYPAFLGTVNPQGLPILPILFITVACGACSGFHCMIASGTSSKQLAKESDAQVVGYGGMLLESFVAVMALGTLMILKTTQLNDLKDPNIIYANGIASFVSHLGINKTFALNFALLAFATFVFDTLDVATRLGRYIFEELTGWKNKWSPYVATLVTLILPLIFLTKQFTDDQGHAVPGWKIFWTVFGSSNQLLAAMVLFGLSCWLYKIKWPFKYVLIPSLFMTVIAVSSIILILKPWVLNIVQKSQFTLDPIAITCVLLLLLTLCIIVEGSQTFFRKNKSSS